MILNKNNNTCLHYVFLNAHLSIIKYLINTYDLIQNDFMKINIYHKKREGNKKKKQNNISQSFSCPQSDRSGGGKLLLYIEISQ